MTSFLSNLTPTTFIIWVVAGLVFAHCRATSDNSAAETHDDEPPSSSSNPSIQESTQCGILIITSNTSARCRCTAIGEIFCNNDDSLLTAIPQFIVTTSNPTTYRSLHLDRQSISHLPPGAFGNISVARVVLNFNPLTNGLDPQTFDGLRLVATELELGACGLSSLPLGLLDDMEQLRRLHLWSNSIRRIPGGFFRSAGALEELLLWSNELDELDNLTLAGLWSLRRLDLDRNRIAELRRDAFRHLLELELLRLGENRITALHASTFSHMKRLRAMSLDRNRIRYVHDQAFDGLSQLVSLDLTGNEIAYLPDNLFKGLQNLVELRLANNRLEYVWTRTFGGLRSLRRLDLSANKIADLPDGVFRNSPGLEQLVLDDNQLTTLRRCTIVHSTSTVASSPVDIDNDANSFEKQMTSSSIRTVSLVGNPIRCDCRLAWIVVTFPGTDRPAADWGGGRTVRLRGSCQVGGTSSPKQSYSAGGSYIAHSVNNWTQTIINGLQSHHSPVHHSFVSRLTSTCTSSAIDTASRECP
jgi:Leucine-rich repeat (LRR) protein